MLSANTSLEIPSKQAQDVEMLSAKAKEESTDEALSVSGMASMDTKARIIAALSSKKRHRLETEKEKPRPITALQRQREREERRRKKKEKAQERKKKENMKEPKGLSLTDADKSLLERWKKLAQPTQLEEKPEPSNIVLSDTKLTNMHNADFMIPQVPVAPSGEPPAALPFVNSTGPSVPFIAYDANQPQNFVSLAQSVLNSSAVNPVVSLSHPFPALIASQNNEQIPVPPAAVSSVYSDSNVPLSKSEQDKAAGSVTDSLSVITKQFKRSHVEDLTLTQTPKGTGGGYGVGFDIEFDLPPSGGNRQPSACLSASLLTDWMELTDNIEIPNLEGALDLDSPLDFSNLPEPFPK
ncbi:hypothetical protein CAPTEDRAFT_194051 [Capitella teleta]|uniref:Uncharacterized protein n=1 Tax=Capitella teleta TaxID=283909 RepID=R7UW85_CAPTE|nr:hypothetical protein CAPTEDRAFT_194051 [Capitella teleta]|eukprot:ELU10584.1 hypothetical protein CAPTEDRAFT_194051 [Capitella teleta]